MTEPGTTSTSEPDAAAPPRRGSPLGWVFVPLAAFLAITLVFMFGLTSEDPSRLPSTLIGRKAPDVAFAPLEGLRAEEATVPGFSASDLAAGSVSVVNFWASWCVPCTEEHPLLAEIGKRTGVKIFGVNYKDSTANARRFLGRHGNPFTAVGVDAAGRGAIEWGVYGMPETFVVDGKGVIVFKHVGPISASSLESKIIPAIEKARAGSGSAQ